MERVFSSSLWRSKKALTLAVLGVIFVVLLILSGIYKSGKTLDAIVSGSVILPENYYISSGDLRIDVPGQSFTQLDSEFKARGKFKLWHRYKFDLEFVVLSELTGSRLVYQKSVKKFVLGKNINLGAIKTDITGDLGYSLVLLKSENGQFLEDYDALKIGDTIKPVIYWIGTSGRDVSPGDDISVTWNDANLLKIAEKLDDGQYKITSSGSTTLSVLAVNLDKYQPSALTGRSISIEVEGE